MRERLSSVPLSQQFYSAKISSAVNIARPNSQLTKKPSLDLLLRCKRMLGDVLNFVRLERHGKSKEASPGLKFIPIVSTSVSSYTSFSSFSNIQSVVSIERDNFVSPPPTDQTFEQMSSSKSYSSFMPPEGSTIDNFVTRLSPTDDKIRGVLVRTIFTTTTSFSTVENRKNCASSVL